MTRTRNVFCALVFTTVFVGCGQATISISDDRGNGFWRKPSVFWKTSAEWESHEISRVDAFELPAECSVFFISIPDKYLRETNYFFRFKRNTLLEKHGYEKYVIRWIPDDRMSCLWLIAHKEKSPACYCKGVEVRGLPSRSGTTTGLTIRGGAAAVVHTVPK